MFKGAVLNGMEYDEDDEASYRFDKRALEIVGRIGTFAEHQHFQQIWDLAKNIDAEKRIDENLKSRGISFQSRDLYLQREIGPRTQNSFQQLEQKSNIFGH